VTLSRWEKTFSCGERVYGPEERVKRLGNWPVQAAGDSLVAPNDFWGQDRAVRAAH